MIGGVLQKAILIVVPLIFGWISTVLFTPLSLEFLVCMTLICIITLLYWTECFFTLLTYFLFF